MQRHPTLARRRSGPLTDGQGSPPDPVSAFRRGPLVFVVLLAGLLLVMPSGVFSASGVGPGHAGADRAESAASGCPTATAFSTPGARPTPTQTKGAAPALEPTASGAPDPTPTPDPTPDAHAATYIPLGHRRQSLEPIGVDAYGGCRRHEVRVRQGDAGRLIRGPHVRDPHRPRHLDGHADRRLSLLRLPCGRQGPGGPFRRHRQRQRWLRGPAASSGRCRVPVAASAQPIPDRGARAACLPLGGVPAHGAGGRHLHLERDVGARGRQRHDLRRSSTVGGLLAVREAKPAAGLGRLALLAGWRGGHPGQQGAARRRHVPRHVRAA